MRLPLQRVRAVLARGGTSNGVFFSSADLPPPGPERDSIVLRTIGPDPTGMQIDGLGGGISSTSKVAVVGPSKQLRVARATLQYVTTS